MLKLNLFKMNRNKVGEAIISSLYPRTFLIRLAQFPVYRPVSNLQSVYADKTVCYA